MHGTPHPPPSREPLNSTSLVLGNPVAVPLVSPAGSGTSRSDSPPDCHSILSVSLRYFEKAEATAKAKYDRLVKLVDFYS